MDIQRAPKSKTRLRLLWAGGGLLVLAGVLGLSRLKPAAPEVERQSLLLGKVEQGAMVFQVRGTGTLVPVDIRILSAQVSCRVERIVRYPGTELKEGDVIAELSSPELQQGAQEAHWNLRRAQADYEVSYLSQKGTVASARARHEDCAARLATEQARLVLFEGKGSNVAPAKAALEQARAQYELKQSQVASLQVRAAMAGMLQQVPLQVGQQLSAGATLAKVAKPLPLKAELKVSETQAKDLLVGQLVSIDTRNGLVKGRVIRIDPSVQNGTVTVDASLDETLPKGARPDLSVEGIIELDRADRALFVGRPVQAQSFGTLSLFKVSADGREATRIKVKLGRASVSTVEILEGLKEGEQVILSDTSQFDNVDRIRLK